MKLNACALQFHIFILNFMIISCEEVGYQDLIFVILSQQDSVHKEKVLKLEQDLKTQTKNKSIVYLSDRDLYHVGHWAVIPLFERLWRLHNEGFEWLFFCTDKTKFNVTNLMQSVNKQVSEATFLGRAIYDLEPTIIHHFASTPGLKYPLFASGFGLNFGLLKRLMESTKKEFKRADFSIDASYELALFIKKNANGIQLTNDNNFCLEYMSNCATFVDNSDLCEKILDVTKIFFAVKTCKKFHKDRIPVVQSTWAKNCHRIAFFSDAHDNNIPTIKLNIPNVKSGHCMKTQAILRAAKKYLVKNPDLQWIVLSDDDTLLGVHRMLKVVGCYNPNKAYVLGERYGFNVYSKTGYNYITGGGGAALSRGAVMKLTSGACECPSQTTPDDMFLLGICLQRLNITLVHIPLFHQARPNDYSKEYLQIGKPISFHKHWMIDPIQTYEDWFQDEDVLLDKRNPHFEL